MKQTFRRREQKYLLNAGEFELIKQALAGKLEVDEYGKTTIQSLYYDTPSFQLIRASNEKPVYKEKLRLRAYGLIGEDDIAFLEIKKKFKSVVYKRRIPLPERAAIDFFDSGTPLPPSQIANEITYLNDFYGKLKPRMLMLYDRTAYFSTDGSDLRITFDENARFRSSDLNLHTSLDGTPLTKNGQVIMEIKSSYGIPLWLCKVLSDNEIYKTSFSKYGTAYNMVTARLLQEETLS